MRTFAADHLAPYADRLTTFRASAKEIVGKGPPRRPESWSFASGATIVARSSLAHRVQHRAAAQSLDNPIPEEFAPERVAHAEEHIFLLADSNAISD